MLTLSAKGKRGLARHHVGLAAQKPGTRSKSRYSLPERSGSWDFSQGTGSVTFKGGLRVRAGKRTVTLGSVTFNRPKKGKTQVTAILRGHKVQLFTASGRGQVKHSGSHETITGLTVRLARPSARLIDKLLHRRAVSTGQVLGSLAITVSQSSGASGSTAAAQGAHITFANQFAALLGGHSSILPINPASGGLPGPAGTTTIPGADGTEVTLPLAGASAAAKFNRGTATGTIPLGGGVTLSNGTASASLTDPQLTLGTGTEGSSLSFSVNGGPEVKLFSLDTAQLQKATTTNGSLDLKRLTATLSSQGAGSLNSALGTHAFTTGQAVGGLSVIVPAH